MTSHHYHMDTAFSISYFMAFKMKPLCDRPVQYVNCLNKKIKKTLGGCTRFFLYFLLDICLWQKIKRKPFQLLTAVKFTDVFQQTTINIGDFYVLFNLRISRARMRPKHNENLVFMQLFLSK